MTKVSTTFSCYYRYHCVLVGSYYFLVLSNITHAHSFIIQSQSPSFSTRQLNPYHHNDLRGGNILGSSSIGSTSSSSSSSGSGIDDAVTDHDNVGDSVASSSDVVSLPVATPPVPLTVESIPETDDVVAAIPPPSQTLTPLPETTTAAAASTTAIGSSMTAVSPISESVSVSSASSISSSMSSSDSSWWDHVPMGLPDSILGIAQAYRECRNPNKVNICIGAYRDENGQPYILPSVLQAEWQLLHQSSAAASNNGVIVNNKEYLPIEGDADFIRSAVQFAYGADIVQSSDIYIAAVQTLSGTGACRIGGHFLQQFVRTSDNNKPSIYIPVPTWGNHWKIFQECGLETKPYRYYDSSTNTLDFSRLMEDIQNAPSQSIILLHACAHNPTGCDPTPDQWIQIANVMAQKQHICFFDSAYQGFASGNAEADAWSLRYFVQERRNDIPVLLAQSFAKNFGLYGERCGTLSVICQSPKQYEKIMSQLKNIIRPMYSSPPKHGSSIVKTVLHDPILSQQYYDECRTMAERIGTIRLQFVQALIDAGSRHDWNHIRTQIGMFAFTGMNSNMCDVLTNDYAIYLTRDGRISLAGLNEHNIQYVANAVHAVTFNQPITTASVEN